MPRLTRFHSLLDRFEERLQVDCERLKHELVSQVDRQFGVLRTKVIELRSRFGSNLSGTVNIDSCIDDPSVETVPLDECIQEPEEQLAALANQASTSSGRKRKFPSAQFGGVKKRSFQASASASNRKYACKFSGCGRSFVFAIELARHERIHLDVKPFFCTWPNCHQSSRNRCNIIKHIRVVHFKLPKTAKQQQELNIVDERDPNEYIRVDTALLNRYKS